MAELKSKVLYKKLQELRNKVEQILVKEDEQYSCFKDSGVSWSNMIKLLHMDRYNIFFNVHVPQQIRDDDNFEIIAKEFVIWLHEMVKLKIVSLYQVPNKIPVDTYKLLQKADKCMGIDWFFLFIVYRDFFD